MDTLNSSEFRRRYASLTKPTIVTAGGHVIGLWTPRPPMSELYAVDAARLDLSEAVVRSDPHIPDPRRAYLTGPAIDAHSFREFRPAPKPGKK